MNLSTEFKNFCTNIKINDEESIKWKKRINKITKKLNKKYYDCDSEQNNMVIVGSVGRKTAITKNSDWDCIFYLPKEVYKRFNNYESNGQSQLLQEIKNEILSLYTTTEIKGDGQVVVISFGDGDIELVPGFLQNEGYYLYPDSNNGGSRKKTDPIAEQTITNNLSDLTHGHYTNFCQIMRTWKNSNNFSFKGLLIDTLIYNYFKKNNIANNITYSDYVDIIKEIFNLLSRENKETSYWHALGSNQFIYNDDNCEFVDKAKIAYNKLIHCKDEQSYIKVFRYLFGKDFANEIIHNYNIAPFEEFIENKFDIDIKYNFNIDCLVSANGFRDKKLSEFLKNKYKLNINKKLQFYVENKSIPKEELKSIKWYWKVRNIGLIAIEKDMERGQIFKGNSILKENTNFNGNHYVECYAVLNNTVVARDIIDVPIDLNNGID